MRVRAKDRFISLYGLSLLLSLLLQLIDAPRVVGAIVVAVPFALACVFGLVWLRLGIRDGSLRPALPDHGWAFLTLLLSPR